MKRINEDYPMQNQKTEGICRSVKKTEDKIKSQALRHMGCMVKNMKPYILSDICITVDDASVPTIKECNHPDEKRQGRFLMTKDSVLIKII